MIRQQLSLNTCQSELIEVSLPSVEGMHGFDEACWQCWKQELRRRGCRNVGPAREVAGGAPRPGWLGARFVMSLQPTVNIAVLWCRRAADKGRGVEWSRGRNVGGLQAGGRDVSEEYAFWRGILVEANLQFYNGRVGCFVQVFLGPYGAHQD